MIEEIYDVDINEMRIGDDIKIRFRECLKSFEKNFTKVVENLKKADVDFSDEIEISGKERNPKDRFLDYINEYSYSKTEELFHDQELIKNFRELSYIINIIQKEYAHPLKLHNELKEQCLSKKEDYDKFGSDSDWNVLEDGSSFYFGQMDFKNSKDIITKNGSGIYLDKKDNIFCGNFENGNFQEGIFSRNDEDRNYSYFEGKFFESDENKTENFEGMFIPSNNLNKKRKLIYFDGEIVFNKNSFNGISVSITENSTFEIYRGKIINGRKDGDNTLLISFIPGEKLNSFNKILLSITNYDNGVPKEKGLNYNSERHLIELDYGRNRSLKSIYLKSNTEEHYLYIGNVKMNDKSIYTPCSLSGKLICANGDYYFGEIKDGIKHGRGRYYNRDSSGKMIQALGLYENDKIKTGKIYVDNFLTYEGNFDNNSFSTGKYFFNMDNSGASYEGGFLNGTRFGHGINVYSDGSRYEGNWENNERQGQGTYFYSSNEIKYIGYWIRNKKDGDAFVEKGKIKMDTNWENDKLLSLKHMSC